MDILLIDDDALVTGALKTILETDENVRVTGCGNSGREAVALYEKLRPDILLMDIRMKDMDGLEASREILGRFPEARILLLTTFSDDEYIVRALKTGIRGYLLKQDYASILPALRAVYSGQTVFGSEVTCRLPELLKKDEGFDYAAHGISEKELDIIKAVANGLSNREIADALFLGEGTVRNYLSGILEKLGLRDRTQLAIFYYRKDTQI